MQNHLCTSRYIRRDIETIATELLLADLAAMEEAVPYLDKVVRSEQRSERKVELAAATKALAGLERGLGIRDIQLQEDELDAIASYRLLTAKPMLYAANVCEEAEAQTWVASLASCYGAEKVIAVAGQWEAEMASLDPEEMAEFRKHGVYRKVKLSECHKVTGNPRWACAGST